MRGWGGYQKSRWRSHESGVKPRPLAGDSPIQAISLLQSRDEIQRAVRGNQAVERSAGDEGDTVTDGWPQLTTLARTQWPEVRAVWTLKYQANLEARVPRC